MYITNQWYLVCLIDELKEKNPLPKKILGQELVVFRGKSGKINVIENRCCHRNVLLSLGNVEGENIKCAYHGWEYAGTGKCVSIPSLESDSQIPAVCVKHYPTQEVDHMVWAFIGDAELAASVALPPIPEMKDRPYVFNYHVLEADLKLVAESLIDPYHIDHVHVNSISTFMGNLNRSTVDFNIEMDGKSLVGTYYRKNLSSFFEKFYFGFEPEIKTNFEFHFPHTSKLQINFPGKKRVLYIYEHFYPIEGNKIVMLQITLWDNIFAGFDAFARYFMLKKSNKIVEEDVAFLESNLYNHTTQRLNDMLIKSDKVSIEFAKLWRANTQQYSHATMAEAADSK